MLATALIGITTLAAGTAEAASCPTGFQCYAEPNQAGTPAPANVIVVDETFDFSIWVPDPDMRDHADASFVITDDELQCAIDCLDGEPEPETGVGQYVRHGGTIQLDPRASYQITAPVVLPTAVLTWGRWAYPRAEDAIIFDGAGATLVQVALPPEQGLPSPDRRMLVRPACWTTFSEREAFFSVRQGWTIRDVSFVGHRDVGDPKGYIDGSKAIEMHAMEGLRIEDCKFHSFDTAIDIRTANAPTIVGCQFSGMAKGIVMSGRTWPTVVQGSGSVNENGCSAEIDGGVTDGITRGVIRDCVMRGACDTYISIASAPGTLIEGVEMAGGQPRHFIWIGGTSWQTKDVTIRNVVMENYLTPSVCVQEPGAYIKYDPHGGQLTVEGLVTPGAPPSGIPIVDITPPLGVAQYVTTLVALRDSHMAGTIQMKGIPESTWEFTRFDDDVAWIEDAKWIGPKPGSISQFGGTRLRAPKAVLPEIKYDVWAGTPSGEVAPTRNAIETTTAFELKLSSDLLEFKNGVAGDLFGNMSASGWKFFRPVDFTMSTLSNVKIASTPTLPSGSTDGTVWFDGSLLRYQGSGVTRVPAVIGGGPVQVVNGVASCPTCVTGSPGTSALSTQLNLDCFPVLPAQVGTGTAVGPPQFNSVGYLLGDSGAPEIQCEVRLPADFVPASLPVRLHVAGWATATTGCGTTVQFRAQVRGVADAERVSAVPWSSTVTAPAITLNCPAPFTTSPAEVMKTVAVTLPEGGLAAGDQFHLRLWRDVSDGYVGSFHVADVRLEVGLD